MSKPLHVQVAEALGCKAIPHHESEYHCLWETPHFHCDCAVLSHVGSSGCSGNLANYDTDWAVSGPLIEKYGIELRDNVGGWTAGAWRPRENCVKHLMADGKTPLEAVCKLILRLVLWKGLDVDAVPEEP